MERDVHPGVAQGAAVMNEIMGGGDIGFPWPDAQTDYGEVREGP
jgi:hypothetical protein